MFFSASLNIFSLRACRVCTYVDIYKKLVIDMGSQSRRHLQHSLWFCVLAACWSWGVQLLRQLLDSAPHSMAEPLIRAMCVCMCRSSLPAYKQHAHGLPARPRPCSVYPQRCCTQVRTNQGPCKADEWAGRVSVGDDLKTNLRSPAVVYGFLGILRLKHFAIRRICRG